MTVNVETRRTIAGLARTVQRDAAALGAVVERGQGRTVEQKRHKRTQVTIKKGIEDAATAGSACRQAREHGVVKKRADAQGRNPRRDGKKRAEGTKTDEQETC